MKIQNFLVALVSFEHFAFLALEVFLWTRPLGLKVFRQTREKAQLTASLAANQGLYNGFLGGGLVWGLLHPNQAFGDQIQYYFLACVMVAGLFGAYTVSRRILFIQFLPALGVTILKWNLLLLS
jgi:putative membrane protein